MCLCLPLRVLSASVSVFVYVSVCLCMSVCEPECLTSVSVFVCMFMHAYVFPALGTSSGTLVRRERGGCTMQAFQSRLKHTVALVLTGTAFEIQAEKEHSPPHGAKDLGEGVQDTCRKLKTMLLCVIFS